MVDISLLTKGHSLRKVKVTQLTFKTKIFLN